MNYFYCDSCFLITLNQENYLKKLKKYKDQFFISKTQLDNEIIKPINLANTVKECVSVILEDTKIIETTIQYKKQFSALSYYDCLCLSFGYWMDFCLVSDDACLIKKANILGIKIKKSKQIIELFELNK